MSALQLLWFKRDLRIADHAPLAGATAAGPVVAVYVHEPEQQQAADRDLRHECALRDALDELRSSLLARGGTLLELHGALPDVFATLHAAHEFASRFSSSSAATVASSIRARKIARPA